MKVLMMSPATHRRGDCGGGWVRVTDRGKKKDAMEKKGRVGRRYTKRHAYVMLALQASGYTANLERMRAR